MRWIDERIRAFEREQEPRHAPDVTFADIVGHADAGDWEWFARTGVEVTHPAIWRGLADLVRRVEALERRA